MVAPSTWIRYMTRKIDYSFSVSTKAHGVEVPVYTVLDTAWKNVLSGRLTFLHCWNKGEEMAPTIGTQGGTLLVRKIPDADPTNVHVGDVVVLKDPNESKNYLVRRLAAIEGYEMASTDEKDEAFVLDTDQCWVLADNDSLKAKEAYDSRTFGPVTMSDIIGRVIYCLRSAVDHGPVNNSHFSAREDSPVLEVELDVDEMAKKPQSITLQQKRLYHRHLFTILYSVTVYSPHLFRNLESYE